MSSPRVPRFRVWPLLLWGALLYGVMAIFFALFFLMADAMKQDAAGGRHPGLPPDLLWTLGIQALGLVLAAGAVIAWHRPLTRTFRALAQGAAPLPLDKTRARRRVFHSPLIVGVGFSGLQAAALVALSLFHHAAAGAPAPPETRALPMSLLFLLLTGFFTYLWQRHRIQTRYLVHLFSLEELATKLPPSQDRGIGTTLVILAVLSSVLPVVVVLTLLLTGVTRLSDTTNLSAAEWTLLLGNADLGHRAAAAIASLGIEGVPVLLINTVDTWRILVGSVLGVSFMFGYVFFVFRWVRRDLTAPLYSLRDAMKRIEEGRQEPAQPVVTSNEIGELTLGFNRMMKGLGERDRIKGLFGQYLTREVSEAILEGRVNLGGDRYEVTVMFTDIRDFTSLSEQLSPEEVFGFLNEYLDAMIEVLVARDGFIDKFLGDGILAVFGLPVRTEDHALSAFEAARDMQTKLTELNRARVEAGKTPISIGSGLHTGPVIAGNVGSSRKLQFTVIGDTVNLASRLEGLNKRWGSTVTLSEATWLRLPAELRSSLPFVKEPGVEIRGKKDPLTLYRLH